MAKDFREGKLASEVLKNKGLLIIFFSVLVQFFS